MNNDILLNKHELVKRYQDLKKHEIELKDWIFKIKNQKELGIPSSQLKHKVSTYVLQKELKMLRDYLIVLEEIAQAEEINLKGE